MPGEVSDEKITIYGDTDCLTFKGGGFGAWGVKVLLFQTIATQRAYP